MNISKIAHIIEYVFGLFMVTHALTIFADTNAFSDLSIEALVKMPVPVITQAEETKKKMLNVNVSSVSKVSQPLSSAAAAVYVIDNEAIKRSGVTSVPEALRMAPGIDVARINNSKWAVTARGFNGRFANKLLVLIDGRSVYTPDFSGVYWDSQDVMLEDVERIEVIRGPGATLWGANAMNGVINIITKHTEDTQGGLLTAGGGSQETGFGALRYGAKLGEETFAKAYVKGFLRDPFTPQNATNQNEDWQQFQGGFRLDSLLSAQDNLMLQANAYNGQPKQTLATNTLPIYQDNAETTGWNLTSRFNHSLSSTADYSLQFYYDHSRRQEYIIDVERDTLDLDFQNTFAMGHQQSVIWGLGYRYSEDFFKDSPLLALRPNKRNVQLFSAFVQDEFSMLNDKLLLMIGSKFEHNDYTGFEIQPSVSLIWTPALGHKLWGSIARAVRTPSRAEHNSQLVVGTYPVGSEKNPLPVPVNLIASGEASYKAEQQLSYQLGYRLMFNNSVSWDLTTFYNDYDTLRSETAGAFYFANNSLNFPYFYNNAASGNTYGIEMSGVWQLTDYWRWDLNYSLLKTELKKIGVSGSAVSPEHTLSLRTGMIPFEHFNADIWLRRVSSAVTINPLNGKTTDIKGYFSLDVRLAWQPIKPVELSLVGQNLLQTQHLEYIDESYALPAGVPRAVYAKVSWQF